VGNTNSGLVQGLARCVVFRAFLLLFLLTLQWLAPANAATNCTVVDLMPAFWQALAGKDPAAQMRISVIDPHPDLYNDNYVRLPIAAEWAGKLAHEKTYDEAHRPEVNAAEQYLAANVPRFMQEFQQLFPDYRCDFTFYIAPSFGNMDGSATTVNGQHRIIFAPDVIPRLHKLNDLKVLIDHETFHIYHHQATGVFGVDEQAIPTIEAALWSEGLATFVSWRMNPAVSLDVALLQPGIPEGARAHMPAIATELLTHLQERDESTYARFFEGAKPPEGYPARAGYYVGVLIAQNLSKRYTLRELAHLKGSVLHDAIVSELQRLRGSTDAATFVPSGT
jgi:hypothetical protein